MRNHIDRFLILTSADNFPQSYKSLFCSALSHEPPGITNNYQAKQIEAPAHNQSLIHKTGSPENKLHAIGRFIIQEWGNYTAKYGFMEVKAAAAFRLQG